MSHPVLGSTGGKGPGMGAIIGGVLALIVIAVGAYFLSSGSDAPEESSPGIPVPVSVAPATDASSASTVTPVSEAPRADSKPGDEARALIAKLRAADAPIDLQQVHVRAVRFAEAKQPVDAYLLWFFAAREGHGPSAFVLGEMYDPEYFDADAFGAVIGQPDPAQALKWYQRALNAGEVMADERIAALTERIEHEAADGDDDARRLMLGW